MACSSQSAAFQQLRTQTTFNLIAFTRNPASTFFTIVLPIIFLVVFTTIFGNEEVANGRRVATFYVPAILALALISATMVNLAITLTSRREQGVLKRVRATPLAPWIFIVAQGLAGMALSIFMAVLFVGIGWALFDVTVQAVGIIPFVVSVLLGAAAFSALGVALTTIITSEEAAPAVTNAVVLPLYFISDIFIISGDGSPAVGGFLATVANLFPIKHLGQALSESFDPFASEVPLPVDHWLMLAVWGVIGLLVGLWKFRWVPRR